MVHIVFWSSLCGFCTTDEGLQFMWAFSRTNAPTPRQLRLLVHRRNQREKDETEKRGEEERDGTGCSERYEPATYSVCGIIFCRFDVGLDNCIPLMEVMKIFKVNCDVHRYHHFLIQNSWLMLHWTDWEEKTNYMSTEKRSGGENRASIPKWQALNSINPANQKCGYNTRGCDSFVGTYWSLLKDPEWQSQTDKSPRGSVKDLIGLTMM